MIDHPGNTPDAAAADVPTDVLAAVAAAGAADAGGLPVTLLGDFLPVLASAVVAGEPIAPVELRPYRRLGDRAARDGVALRALLDLYLSAAWRLWEHLPPVRGAAGAPEGVVAAGGVMLHGVDDVVAALVEGYQLARRSLTRSAEAARREFIDDLLGGAADVVALVHRADGFGLHLAGPHAVLTVHAERPFDDGSPLIATLERAVAGSKGDDQPLLASKDGALVVVFAAPDRAAVEQTVERVAATLDRHRGGRVAVGDWKLGIGRAAPGADGVLASYRESRDALQLADRLGLDTRVIDAGDLLAHRMLLRDRAALAELVETVLGPLHSARGGAGPLLDTLEAYFNSGGNSSDTARRLHLSVRAVTYRLERVRELTGHDPGRAGDRFPLQMAVLGARLTGWAHS